MNSFSLQSVRGYQLLERLGSGGFGAVYRAIQPSVGRDVAIKVILPEHANQPDFIRRFEVEAQLVARLEHPYIVPLYDYWREPGGAYLVMRYLRGGSLRASLMNGAWASESAVRLLDQIASALTAAHRQGVIHRDVKPENILLDEEGNAYLEDFGIAKNISASAHTQTGMVTGSLAYISPEMAQSRPLTPVCDLYSLAVVMYEVLTGEHPFPGLPPTGQLFKHLTEPLPHIRESRPELPEALEAVIQRATAKEPEKRYADVLTFAAEFRAALTGRSGLSLQTIQSPDTEILEAPNPYKGLRAFQEADASDFFGRDALLKQLLARLSSPTEGVTHGGKTGGSTEHPNPPSSEDVLSSAKKSAPAARFLAIVGPSGSGKSSIVKAGLIPALRKAAMPGSQNWFILEMLPGSHPFEELEIGLLCIAAEKPPQLMEQLRRDERGLLRAARLALPSNDPDCELLLVIDQFEELFTLVEDKAETTHFLASIFAAVSDPRSRVRVVITLRADFYDRPLMDPDFSGLMQKYTEVVVPLSADELAAAIQKPVEQCGATFEPGLVTAIIADVKDQPSVLPLLQYALTELYERRRGRLLTRSAYKQIGSVLGVLSRRAEEVFADLAPREQEAARQLFLRLVTLGEGTEDTRRRVLRTELDSLAFKASIQAVIEAFGLARLLSFDRDPLTRGSTVEVAHEALLREWLEDSRSDVRQQRLLAAAAVEWINAGRDPGFLLAGARLNQFEGWSVRTAVALTLPERDFLTASLAERQTQQEAETLRQRRELEIAQKLAETEKQRAEAEKERAETEMARAESEKARAEEQSRAARNLHHRALWLTGALVVAAILALAAAWFSSLANQSATRAEAEAHARATAEAIALTSLNHSEAQRLAGEANQLILKQGNPELIALLALRSLKLEYTPQGDEAIEGAARMDYPTGILYHVTDASFITLARSNDLRFIASGTINGDIHVWDIKSGQEIRQFTIGTFPIMTKFSFDSRYLVTTGANGIAYLWDITSGKKIRQIANADIKVMPDGQHILVNNAGTIQLQTLESGQVEKTYTGAENPLAVEPSPDGRLIAAISKDGNQTWVWDASSGILKHTFVSAQNSGAAGIDFIPNQNTLLTVGYNGTARLWDLESGQLLHQFENNNQISAECYAISPDGKVLLVNTLNGVSYLWDLTGGAELRHFSNPSQTWGAAFFPDGHSYATANADGSIRLWEMNLRVGLPSFPKQPGGYSDVVFSPDGRSILSAGFDGIARLWDIESKAELRQLRMDAISMTSARFSPDGKTILTTSLSGNAILWETDRGQEIRRFGESTFGTIYPYASAFSTDGKRLAILWGDPSIRIWDMTNMTQQREIKLPNFGETLALSPLGDRALFAGGGKAFLYNTDSGVLLHEFIVGQGTTEGLAFSPSGKLITTGSSNGSIILWDVASGAEVRRLSGHTALVYRAVFSADGQYLLTASFDRTARLWDVTTGKELRRFAGHTDSVNGADFSSGGKTVVTTSADGTVRLWYRDINDTIASLCGRLLRDLTDGERAQYGIQDQQPTCKKQ